ncbi:M1 family metallopeptidase [Antarcticibacterium arcticum]|uniref:M1 family metallopeptidase n=1 Tax=Antarcticibacterium arcticum TaxID=2585771 RepID=A0A5B8YF08_9FLAO|nr:M1 family metallopeptidase [Antarcticibacterium arcticum]QED36485.1 M1 family metallopeptidase [Antarcticibacterium arcticum]
MKIKFFLVVLLWGLGITFGFSQTSINITAVLNDSTRTFNIQQEIIYENTSAGALPELYFNDWANSFKDKSTPLAKRFAEDYLRRFHFAKDEERGFTKIYSITNQNVQNFTWERPEGFPDIIKVELTQPLLPGEKISVNFLYQVKIPSEKFTRYGVDDQGNYKLKYWYITPAVFDGEWKIYSDKNLGNQFTVPANYSIKLTTPPSLYVASVLNTDRFFTDNGFKTTYLSGENHVNPHLYLTKTYRLEALDVNSKIVLTSVEDDGLIFGMKGMILNRILKFLETRLGAYPQETIMVTREDYLNNPVYGLNQLPQFIRPFPDGFQYDIKQLKTITENYLRNTLFLNPREEKWVYDAIHISLMMDYVDTYYPDMKLMGSLSSVIGIRWFHAASLEFNDQYPLLYLNMARLNIDQPLTTSQDSLVKFNVNIANAYKAGTGLKYLETFLNDETVKNSIKEFYKDNLLQSTEAADFREILERNTQKDISWFFDDYVSSSDKIDFKIKHVKKVGDSLQVTIKNKKDNNMPVPLYGLKDGDIIYKTWVENTREDQTITIPRHGIERLALNHEAIIPEINRRDNYRGVTTLLNKPVQFRLLQDLEDPRYYQVFFMPEVSYNLYDGIAVGPKVYNKPFLNRNFDFRISPKFGFNSQTIVGSGSISNSHYYDEDNLFAIRYGISGVRFSYGYDLFYEKFTPHLGFFFRNSYLRDNERQSLILRNINVKRDFDLLNPVDQPNYNVFNLSYNYSDTNLVDYVAGGIDYELAKNFSKVAVELEYRKLFRNNRQINLRLFAGTFIYNDERDNDYFSFALDRPTDYLFDYNYYGRSQGSGLFSQQIIMAEGGFKSQLEPAFANQWLTTINASTNLWKWIFAYGDVGLVKNQFAPAHFVYDSGLRVSLVQDYFEIFFPVYSNLGWEIAQDNYDQKIRFIVTLDINTLIRLFTREWY